MIQFKKLTPLAKIPTRAHPEDAGLDLYYSGNSYVLAPGERRVFSTGIAMAIPYGTVGLIWPRSGLSVKKGIDVLAGVIDSNYRGEIMVALVNLDPAEYVDIFTGDKIAQLLIQEIKYDTIVKVTELDETQRGKSGFGSTGN